MTKQEIINRLAELELHDCKLSEDASCDTCQNIYFLKDALKALDEVTEDEWNIEGLSHWGASERSESADIADGELDTNEN